MTQAENKARRAWIYFRNAAEKNDAQTFAAERGHGSLNAYMLSLYRNDKRRQATYSAREKERVEGEVASYNHETDEDLGS